jgi:vacuolar-type H+-ATPase subunit I/STV1
MATGIARSIIDKTLLGLFVVLYAMLVLPRYSMPWWEVWLIIEVASVTIGIAVWFLTLFWDSNLNLVRNIIDHLLTGFVLVGMLLVILPVYKMPLEQQWVVFTFAGIVISIVIWAVIPGERNAKGKKGSSGSRHGGK